MTEIATVQEEALFFLVELWLQVVELLGLVAQVLTLILQNVPLKNMQHKISSKDFVYHCIARGTKMPLPTTCICLSNVGMNGTMSPSYATTMSNLTKY